MKKILTLFVILFLCGCSSQYTLKIDEDKITEEIAFAIDKNKIHEQDLGPYLDLYSKETIDSLVNNDLYVEVDSTKYIYKKEVIEENNQLLFNLKHDYIDNEISDSRILNDCFENKEFEVTDDKISIHLYGKYNCLVNDEDSVEFKITTGNKIVSSSLEHNFLTNDFIWKIDKNNANNVDIELTVLTETKAHYYGIRGAVVLIIVFVLGLIVYAAHKLTKRADINEI